MATRPALRSPAWRYPDYVRDALQQSGFEERDYQKVAVAGALSLLRKRRSAEIDLPPGTGKTLVGHIVAWIWEREIRKSNCVLILVPSTVLREQHSHAFCQWIPRGDCPSIEWSTEWLKSKKVWHPQRAEHSRVFFALPESLAASIRSGQMPHTVWDRIGLVIVDEYDSFSLGTLLAEGADLVGNDRENIQLKLSLSSLVPHLKSSPRVYLRLSATPMAQAVAKGVIQNETAGHPRLHGQSVQSGRSR